MTSPAYNKRSRIISTLPTALLTLFCTLTAAALLSPVSIATRIPSFCNQIQYHKKSHLRSSFRKALYEIEATYERDSLRVQFPSALKLQKIFDNDKIVF